MLTLLVALAVLLAGVTPAHAGFLVPLIAGAAFAATTAGVIITAAANVALAVGLSFVANRLLRPKAPRHQPQEQPAGGVELDVRLDADVPQSIIFGRAVTAGSRIYAETYGTGGAPNNNLIEIIALADHPCEGLVKVFVEGQDESFTSTGDNRGNTLDDYQSKLAFRFFDGTQTSHDEFTTAALGSHAERPWTSDMIGHGRTYARNHYVYDQELVPGLLRWRYVVDGIKLYDPRKDSTVGGSGSHRFGDLDTHEFTQNLIVIAYNILRGIRVADHVGTPRHFYGLENTPADNMPLDVWFAAMNEADLTVDGEPQFHGGAEIGVDTEPLEVVREILKACDGRLVEIGGTYKVYIGPPGLPVMTFNDSHIRVDSEEAFKPIRPLVERINHVAGKYTSPEDGWIPKVAPARVDSDAEEADGRRVTGELDAPWVQSGKHIQRLQKQMLFRARKERRHTLPLPPEMYGLEPGDIVEWTSQRNGYIDKLFEVEAAQDHHDLTSTITILELDEDDYDWTPATDLIPEPDGSLVTTRPTAKVIDGFQAIGFIHSSPNGAQRPAIKLTWTPPEDDDVTGVAFQIRTADDPDNVASDQTDEPEAGEVIILANLLPDTDYEIRARFRSFNGYATDWSLWIPVTTPAVAIGSADFDTVPPGPVTNLAVDLEGFKTISLTWTNPTDDDLDHIELWFNDSNNFSTSTHGGNYRGETGVVTGLETSTQYWFWAVAVDWAGNKADESDPATGTTRQLFTDEMADLLVTAAKLDDKAVVARTINDAAIQALHLDTDSVTTTAIADAAVEAGKIAENAVANRHLLVGSFDNLIQNPGAELAGLHPFFVQASGGGTWANGGPGSTARSGNSAIRYATDGQTAAAFLAANGPQNQRQHHAAAAEGDRFYFEVWVRHGSTATVASTGVASIVWRDATGGAISAIHSATFTTTGAYQRISVSGVAPAGVAFVVFRVQVNDGGDGNVWFDDFYARRMVDGEIVVDEAITASKVAAEAITAGKIAASAVGETHLQNLSVSAAKVQAAAIETAKLADGAITEVKVGTDAISAPKIQANAVIAGKIASNAVTTVKLDAEAVTAAKIAANAVTTTKVAANAIQAGHIAADQIQAGHIAAGAVTTAKVAALAITSNEIAANAVIAAKIAANAIQAGHIAAGEIQAGHIAAGAVTTNALAANSVNAGKIQAGVISAQHLVIGSFDNLIQNPGAEQPDLYPFFVQLSGGGTWANGGPGSTARSGISAIRYNTSGQTSSAFLAANGPQSEPDHHAAAAQGDRFYFEVWVRHSGGATSSIAVASLVWFGATGSQISAVNETFNTTGAYQRVTVEGTAPAGVAYVVFRVQVNAGGSGNVWFDDFYARRMVEGSIIVDGAILAKHIEAGAVVAGKVAANAIGANEIAANAIASGHLTSHSVIADKIATGAVMAAKIDAGAVTTVKLAAGAVDTSALANAAATAQKLANNSVETAKIINAAVTGGKLDDASVTATKIAANAVVADKIAANAITAVKILAGAVETSKITIGGVTTDRIATGAVSAIDAATTADTLVTTTSEMTLQSVTITTGGGRVALDAMCRIIGAASGTHTHVFRLRRSGTLLRSMSYSGDSPPFVSMQFLDNSPGSGSRTYTFTVQRTAGTVAWDLDERFLRAIEMKR